MNIIFDTDDIERIKGSNLLLELDTFYFSKLDKTVTAYCVIENVKIDELDKIPQLTNLHDQLMYSYKHQEFSQCQQLIGKLIGSFSGEVDSFYHELSQRIQDLLMTPPADNWTPIISKND